MRRWICLVSAVAALSFATAACEGEDPVETPSGGSGGGSEGGFGGGSEGGSGGGTGGTGGAPNTLCDPWAEDVSGCSELATDFRPREPAADDAWPVCVSDGGAYVNLEPSVSSIARTEAYETMRGLLWGKATPPAADDFTTAREAYAVDQGLGSRVERRFDPHYPKPAAGSCTDAGVPEANPDYCVGPAKLLPIVNAAFQAGQTGQGDPIVHAARLEAALGWFFVASTYKESVTSQTSPKDVDSSLAYFNGGVQRDEAPIGVAADLVGPGRETYDRVLDGIYAVRCWRDVEGVANVDPAAFTHADLRDRAFAQLDVALNRGAALLARQRLQELACSDGADRTASFEFLKVWLPLLDRAVREADPAKADVVLAVANAADAAAAAGRAEAAIDALDTALDCP